MTTWQYLKLIAYLTWSSIAKTTRKAASQASDIEGSIEEASGRLRIWDSAKDGVEASQEEVSMSSSADGPSTSSEDPSDGSGRALIPPD